jgi:hypothetical protein
VRRYPQALKKLVTMSNFVQFDVSCLAQIILSKREVMMHTKDRLADALREARVAADGEEGRSGSLQ